MATVSSPPCQQAAPSRNGDLSIITDRQLFQVPSDVWTFAGFRAWATSGQVPEYVRVAFLGQEVVLDMSNEELETHVLVKGEIARVLMTLNRQLKKGKFYTDGALLSNEGAAVSNNPDASFVSWEALEAGRVRLVPREGEEGQFVEIEGTPDWVLEVVSANSVQKDMQQLRQAYYQAGIPEYWLVDARGATILFQVLQRRKTGYAAVPNRDGWQRSRVFGRSFRLVRERDRLGMWEYTLEIRPE